MDDLSLERKKLYSRQLAAHTLRQWNAVCQEQQTTNEAQDHAGPENEGSSNAAAINGDSNSGRKGVIYSDCIAKLVKIR